MMIAELVIGKLCSKSASVQALLARKGWTRVRNSRFMDAPFAGGGEFTANANARRAETTPITKTGLILICQYTEHNQRAGGGGRFEWVETHGKETSR
jgi:hypothetical protein